MSRTNRLPRRRLRPALVIGICLAALCAVDMASAVPASPDGVDVTQPDGGRFRLHKRGDEFFSWQETADGHAVVRDKVDGFWKFAAPAADGAAFVAIQNARVGTADPKTLGLKKHALPDAKLLRAHVKESKNRLGDSPVAVPAGKRVPGTTSTTAAGDPRPRLYCRQTVDRRGRPCQG
ncbi:MAG: hypothetical protein QGG69_01045 [Kiritimatiellia bacterium]|nr:hypothetical protein [Kiritimatiellia bacterium]